MSIGSVMPSNHLIPCHPLLLLPSIVPSIRVFSHQSALCSSWLKYWSFSFRIGPSNEHSGLISFRIDWFDLFVVKGSLTSLLQYLNTEALIHWHSGFFIVQFSHPYMTTGKTVTLIKWILVSKVISLLFPPEGWCHLSIWCYLYFVLLCLVSFVPLWLAYTMYTNVYVYICKI